MFNETLQLLTEAAVKKANFLKASKGRYILASAYAGFYVGLGILLIMVVGSFGAKINFAYSKMLMGLSFGIALSLVIMTGSELFTGNNMIMTAGALDKKVTWTQTLLVWLYSYIGNFIGSFAVGYLFVMTGVSETPLGNFIIKVASGKMGGDFTTLFFKGIICNVLVCLAVLCALKMKSESGKLIMIFWCLFAFITIGAEHSIANMTIFAMSLLIKHPAAVSMMGMINNLVPVTLGNIVGGALVLGAGYYYLGSEKNGTEVVK